MENLKRVTAKIFASNANLETEDIGQFGSALAGNKLVTDDVETIQALPAFEQGWRGAVLSTRNYPPLPEMAGLQKVLSYQEAYLLQKGIPEWDSETTYYSNTSFCQVDGTIYKSLTDDNIGNNPTSDTTNWKEWGGGGGSIATPDTAGIVQPDNETTFVNDDGVLSALNPLYRPFAINKGTFKDGTNATLHVPEGSSIESDFVQPILTSPGTIGGDSFAVTANGEQAAYGRYIVNAVDGNPSTVWSGGVSNGGWYEFYNPKPLCVKKLFWNVFATGYLPAELKILCGDTEDSLDEIEFTMTAEVDRVTIDLSSNTEFKKIYRIQTIKQINTNTGMTMKNLQITAKELAQASSSLFCDPCTITTADGRTKNFSEPFILDCSEYEDGEYNVFKNYNNGYLTLYPYDKFILGNSANSEEEGSTWLDTSGGLLNFKVYNGEEWEIKNELVLLGSITIYEGQITKVNNNYLNRCIAYPEIIETYKDGASSYRIWSDGYCEQIGRASRSTTGIINVNLLKTYKDTQYTVLPVNRAADSYTSASTFYTPYVLNVTRSGFGLASNAAIANIAYFDWVAKGYLAEGEY